jgi:ribonuclease P protein component
MRYTHQQHLRTAADFSGIRASGKKWECGFFYVHLLDKGGTRPALRRLGVIASRRIGNAVERNRAKRLLREVFRNNQSMLPENCDLLLVARPSIKRADYQKLEDRFRTSLQANLNRPS